MNYFSGELLYRLLWVTGVPYQHIMFSVYVVHFQSHQEKHTNNSSVNTNSELIAALQRNCWPHHSRHAGPWAWVIRKIKLWGPFFIRSDMLLRLSVGRLIHASQSCALASWYSVKKTIKKGPSGICAKNDTMFLFRFLDIWRRSS